MPITRTRLENKDTQAEEKCMKPITPNEVKQRDIPANVTEAFNFLIKKNWDGSESNVRQKDVVNLILDYHDRDEKAQLTHAAKKRNRAAYREQIFKDHYLDIEDLFRKAGWSCLPPLR